ncbi:AmmeMemoRadiSam system protein B [Methanoculleus sp. YWC-01]|uniref:MEMO1 family protein HL657_04530 n=1 Tax=Methanoculleus nereidis TaxID=2735141 RepID=A0ABU3Z1J3_9EURY|nr:AmmeMemoRadiSam system protein B [Methanoculleus sp. YWC-01]MCK9298435.1 AmmeMemoRadiSam system protein B [Methanoculleus sp.]MDV4342449.1 AmmeMemoRadiSam system protein B [Methanoculleus sp. YWC-01]
MDMRPCSVAGMFYPAEPRHLEQLLETFFRNKAPGITARGVVSPHAGYVYSGETGACAFSTIPPDFDGTFVVIGPSHRGYMTSASAVPWATPLGIVDVDTGFVDALDIEVDEVSHRSEHSIEVQMPFIKYRFPRARVAPVLMGDQSYEAAVSLAEHLLQAIEHTGRNVRIVASSDFSHYVPDEVARRHDLTVIDALKTLDVPEFYHRLRETGATVCGYGPIAAMCITCQSLGAERGELLRYTTSGDVTEDYNQVVGYAAIAVV